MGDRGRARREPPDVNRLPPRRGPIPGGHRLVPRARGHLGRRSAQDYLGQLRQGLRLVGGAIEPPATITKSTSVDWVTDLVSVGGGRLRNGSPPLQWPGGPNGPAGNGSVDTGASDARSRIAQPVA